MKDTTTREWSERRPSARPDDDAARMASIKERSQVEKCSIGDACDACFVFAAYDRLAARLADAEARVAALERAINEAQAILIRAYAGSVRAPAPARHLLTEADGILRAALTARERGGGAGE